MSEDEQRRILRLLAIEKNQRRSHKSLRKWATENFATLGHWKRAAEIKERAAENFSVLKSAPAKACSKKCTSGSRVRSRAPFIRHHHDLDARQTVSCNIGRGAGLKNFQAFIHIPLHVQKAKFTYFKVLYLISCFRGCDMIRHSWGGLMLGPPAIS